MPAKKVWRPFSEAREFARSLKLRGVEEWNEYCKSGKDGIPRPDDIPSSPDKAYKNDGWKGCPDWLANEDRVISEESRRKMREAHRARKKKLGER